MRIILKIFFSLSIFIFCLTIADILLSETYLKNENSFKKKYQKSLSADCFSLDDYTGYKPNWGHCGYTNLSDFEVDKNVLGISDSKKIIILGDSNTEWANYDRILESKLNSLNKLKKQYQVIKMGVAGFNTFQEVNLFFNEAKNISASLIVLQFSANDFKFSPVILASENGFKIMDSKGKITNPIQNLFKYSSIYKFVIFSKIIKDSNNVPDHLKINLVRDSISRLNEFALNQKIPIIVVIYPIFDKNADTGSLKLISKILNSLNIKHLDLSTNKDFKKNPEFYALEEGGKKDPTHSNRNFDPIVAEEVFKEINQNI